MQESHTSLMFLLINSVSFLGLQGPAIQPAGRQMRALAGRLALSWHTVLSALPWLEVKNVDCFST